jgi:hypothetical protein
MHRPLVAHSNAAAPLQLLLLLLLLLLLHAKPQGSRCPPVATPSNLVTCPCTLYRPLPRTAKMSDQKASDTTFTTYQPIR